MRILYVTTVGITMNFFENLVRELSSKGNTVDIATNETKYKVSDKFRDMGCKVFSIPTSRSPFSFGNIKAIKEIRKTAENYDIVHCHTPIAAACTRLGCKGLRKKGVKVIYTAHGFHFYKGAPLKNWIIYYPIEKLCARFTDVLITINREDYEFAKKHLHSGAVEYVPGVGIDCEKFANTAVNTAEKRKELGIPESAYLVLSVGELNENKNHIKVIEALSEIGDKDIFYIIAGTGNREKLVAAAEERGVNLKLPGQRNDIPELLKTCDLFIHPSHREGLPVAVMEAIASGANVAVSDIRGARDLVKTGRFDPADTTAVKNALLNAKNGFRPETEDIRLFDTKEINRKTVSIYGL